MRSPCRRCRKMDKKRWILKMSRYMWTEPWKILCRNITRKAIYCSLNIPGQGRDVGSISNLEGTTSQGQFFLKKMGAFSKIKRALLCLLQNLAGHMPPNAPWFLPLCTKAWMNKKPCIFRKTIKIEFVL